jgi:RNA polymerase sigma factor (sigma-70 family)
MPRRAARTKNGTMSNLLERLIRDLLPVEREERTDARLLTDYLERADGTALSILVRRHGPMVWGVCRRVLWNHHDAEDAFQAAFLVLVRRAGAIANRESLANWLYGVALQVARKARANLARRNQREKQVTEMPEPTVTTETRWADLRSHIDEELSRLPDKYRSVVVLCDLEGKTRQEAARQLDLPEGTVAGWLARGRALLAKRFERRGLTLAGGVLAALITPNASSASVPASLAASTIQAAASGVVSTEVAGLAEGVLRTMLLKKIKFAGAMLFAVAMVALTCVAMLGQPSSPRQEAKAKPTEKAAEPVAKGEAPTLAPGKWVLNELLAPHFPQREATLTIARKDGKPTLESAEGENSEWQARELTVSGNRVRFSLAQVGADVEYHFDGLFDPDDPGRVCGTFDPSGWSRNFAVLELIRPDRPKKRVQAPEVWSRWAEQVRAHARAESDLTRSKSASKEKQAEAKERLEQVEKVFRVEEPKLLRRMVAEEPNQYGFDAATTLLAMTARLQPTAEEIASWADAARRFARTHGPRAEAATLDRFASVLIRNVEYAELARKFAAVADQIAGEEGLPRKSVKQIAAWDEERAAFAALPKRPAKDEIWTVTVKGKVTDKQGKPVAGAEVYVGNTQWVKTMNEDGSYQTKTAADGTYSLPLKCQGEFRLHVTRMGSKKPGFIKVEKHDRLKLPPGGSAAVDFVLEAGEPFGGVLKLPAHYGDHSQTIAITGQGLNEHVWMEKDKKFELTLPAGTYTVEYRHGLKTHTWPGLKTGRTDHVLEPPPFRFTPETVGEGFDQMWKAMNYNYSYFTLKPEIDWAKLRDEYRPKAVKAKSAAELADVLKEMLGHLKDGHVWIEMPGGKQVVGTHRTSWTYNGNRKVVLGQLTDTTECGKFAVVGKTKPDGFGYFLMTQQSSATPESVAKAVAAIEKLADAPGFVIDLRNANGGSEPLAQEIAQLFCGKNVVYAKSRFRNGVDHDQFTEDHPRELPPAKSGKPYLKPVVCLLGPGCVSSGEGFAKMLAALPHVTTVGLPTRGSSGNPGPVEVGGTGLTVYFSRWVDLLPDGTPIEGKGVPVAVKVEAPAEAYQETDPTLAKGLEELRAKIKGK